MPVMVIAEGSLFFLFLWKWTQWFFRLELKVSFHSQRQWWTEWLLACLFLSLRFQLRWKKNYKISYLILEINIFFSFNKFRCKINYSPFTVYNVLSTDKLYSPPISEHQPKLRFDQKIMKIIAWQKCLHCKD